jgi:hypothetical protein
MAIRYLPNCILDLTLQLYSSHGKKQWTGTARDFAEFQATARLAASSKAFDIAGAVAL